MKACVIQPPYSMDLAKSDELFRLKLDYLDSCDESMDLIVLPEYSDICKQQRFGGINRQNKATIELNAI